MMNVIVQIDAILSKFLQEKKYMMYNTVNEKGYKEAKLFFFSNLDGVWSPDSAPEGGCIELKGVGGPSDSKNI